MTHTLVMGLFDTPSAAARAAQELRQLGVPRERVSIVARNHEEEGRLADASGASPGSEIEDSLIASRLGELSAHLIAAAAMVMPGIGPIVADGPLTAGLGEAAGHLAGGVARTLERIGMPTETAEQWEQRISEGAILVGAHVAPDSPVDVQTALERAGASNVTTGTWAD